ncbi:MAG: putative replication initiation protein [Microviridae sp.]|nr:MAG: putative replication initiation protein [Microviridae sp.]
MCISPSVVDVDRGPHWEQVPVPCKRCWQCRTNRVSNYVGRSLCEAQISDWTLALTLTYRDQEDLSHRYITPPHFQKFVRSLRRRGHLVRYLVCGEYGALYGRAHFHVVLFGKGKPPQIPHKKNHHIAEWPHGHVYGDWSSDERALRYVCKYVLKDLPGGAWFQTSKKPAIGTEWFVKKAQRDVALGVLPSTFEYQPPNGHKGRNYLLTGAVRRDYLKAVTDAAKASGRYREGQLSEWVQRIYEKDALTLAKNEALLNPIQEQMDALNAEIMERKRLPEKRLQMQHLYEDFQRDNAIDSPPWYE